MGKWVEVTGQGVIVDANPNTVQGLTPILNLSPYRFLRIRIRALIDYVNTTRYIWTWDMFTTEAATVELTNGNNISGRGDYIDSTAAGGALPGSLLLPSMELGPGITHLQQTGLTNTICIHHTKIPGPWARFSKYLSGAAASAFDAKIFIEGYRED
jgi:hypothetical protein